MSVSINGTGGITFADASTQSTGGYTGFRNRIINGAMMIDQRNAGASYSAAAGGFYYTVDRWAVFSSGAGSTAQQVSGPNTSDKALQVIPAAGNPYQIIAQRIESRNCIDLAGQTVTVSGRLYIDNSTGVSCSVGISAATSTDSNYAAFMGSFAVTLTGGSYVSFSGQISLTSAAANGIELDISFAGAAGKTIKLTGVQLEKGSTATPFEFRPYGAELALCQRYAYVSQSGYAYQTGVVSAAGTSAVTIRFPTTMRAAPTFLALGLAGYGTGSGQYRIYNYVAAGFATAPSTPSFSVSFSSADSANLSAAIGSGTSGDATNLDVVAPLRFGFFSEL